MKYLLGLVRAVASLVFALGFAMSAIKAHEAHVEFWMTYWLWFATVLFAGAGIDYFVRMGQEKMRVLVTGSHGLIGSACVKFFSDKGDEVWGFDNDGRAEFFGPLATTFLVGDNLKIQYPDYIHLDVDITHRGRAAESIHHIAPDVIIHCAAQPSHDWACKNVHRDFEVNAYGTLNLLEAARTEVPECHFVYLSTNKVYGDYPNDLSYLEHPLRYELDQGYSWSGFGFSESVNIDYKMHSLFGVSKLAADLYVQEYGRYFDMKTTVLRGGCLTGAAHVGVEAHGFLSYLFMAAVRGIEYTIYGYEGKQVRDNIHADDVASAIWHIVAGKGTPTPLMPGEVYNIGGGMQRSCSVLEAMYAVEERMNKPMKIRMVDEPRRGDHKWWVTDMSKFQMAYPDWGYTYSLEAIYDELFEVYEGMS